MTNNDKNRHERIVSAREDLSEYVFHFARYPESKGKETLRSILANKVIIDMSKQGFICFTDAPVTQLPAMFKLFEKDSSFHKNYRYAPYGIGVRKDYFFRLGGRPIILSTNEEINKITQTFTSSSEENRQFFSKQISWRLQKFNPGYYDFEWLREWRLPVSEFKLDYDNCIAIVPTVTEHEELLLNFEDCQPIDAEPADKYWMEVTWELEYTRLIKGINIMQLDEMITKNPKYTRQLKKEMLNNDLSSQQKKEIVYKYSVEPLNMK